MKILRIGYSFSMSNLIPEKRVDRNGRLVTKHIRSTPSRPSQAPFPAPAATIAPRSKKLPVARTKPFLWDIYKSQCNARQGLIKASENYAPELNYYFEASDEEAYAVMSTVDPRDIIPLLASGVRTKEEAVVFLHRYNLAYLINDNSSLAEKALSRNIPAQNVAAMMEAFPKASPANPAYFDAMEIVNNKGYKNALHYPGAVQLVLEGKIKLDDLKTIGVKRLKAGGSGDAILHQLEKIADGESKMTAEELAQVISKASSDPSATHPAMVNDAVWLADKHGAELVMRLDQPILAAQLDNSVSNTKFDPSKVEPLLLWHDGVRRFTGLGYLPFGDLVELFEAGIAPEDAAEGLRIKMPVHQIIGVHKNGIQKAVSGGWL